jgi:ribonuclease P protein component
VVQLGRLRRRPEFRLVYGEGVKVSGRYFVLFFREREQGEVRLGITATRKLGSAVVRNRARRRVRELARRYAGALEGWQGDLVVNVHRGSESAPWPALEEDYRRCLDRLGRRVGLGR